ncbi:MAG: hypothetical protein IJO63_00445 [Bacilli bacterium]|nr:hypothetical protein [Bacilli bacterium]
MKKTKIIILLILVVLILAFVGWHISKIKRQDAGDNIYSNAACLKKGNICTDEQIRNGMLVKYEVNDKDSYDFYVIDNNADTLTLIMNKNIVNNVDWHNELINMKGPIYSLIEIYKNCNDWTNVDILNNYEYADYGKKYSDELCAKGEEPSYNCEDLYTNTRGYNGIIFGENKSYLEFNLPITDEDEEDVVQKFDLTAHKLRARMITIEELEKLQNAEWLVENLKHNEGFWTLSSATVAKTLYSKGAYAVVANNSQAEIVPVFVKSSLNDDYKLGIRPVIVIEKR